MKKLTLLLLACIGWAQLGIAQTTNKSLLWEVSGNGLTAPSYLFGTYHFAGKSFADSLPYIKNYFNNCKAVAGEFVIDASAYSKMLPAMTLPDKKTLDKVFTPDEYKLVSDYVQQTLHIGMTNVNNFKPAALDVIILASTAPKTITPENPALDEYFQTEGKARKDTVLGLETIDDQINILLNTPIADQKRHLLTDIRKKDEQSKEMADIYSLYQQQDLDKLGKKMMADDDYTVEEMDMLLKNRNLKWIQELPAIMQRQPTFIAVGAGHLVGQYGLINQLRLKGYTVKAVTK